MANREYRTRNDEQGTGNTEQGMANTEHGMMNKESRTRKYDDRIATTKKKLPTHKPDSVLSYHLSSPNVAVGILLPTLPAIAARQS
jgi:hypothetical protein